MIGLGAINLPLIYRGTPSLFFSNTVAPHERRQGSQKFGKPLGSSFAYTKIGDSVQWNSDQMWLIFTHVKIQISRCMRPFQKHPYGEYWGVMAFYNFIRYQKGRGPFSSVLDSLTHNTWGDLPGSYDESLQWCLLGTARGGEG